MEFTFPNYYKEFSCIAGSCPDWQIQEEQLLVYWIYTYFCGTVYDFTKVKMAVVCTLFIHELDVGTYLKNEHHFNLNAQIQICYQFSGELKLFLPMAFLRLSPKTSTGWQRPKSLSKARFLLISNSPAICRGV